VTQAHLWHSVTAAQAVQVVLAVLAESDVLLVQWTSNVTVVLAQRAQQAEVTSA